jgi:hypothetical protein
LLIESNEEYKVRINNFNSNYHMLIGLQVEQAVREIKRLLIEASAAALQAEMRNPQATQGRYSVL